MVREMPPFGFHDCHRRVEGAVAWSPPRPPVYATGGMVATSQTTATLAGVRTLERGGTAADAVIAAAAVLGVTEPMSTGLGGDAFAIVHRGGAVAGLDAAGPAPAEPPPHADPADVAVSGPCSVDVPGAVAGWASLSERYGRLGLDACLEPAIDIAQGGFALGAHTARLWREAEWAPPGWDPRPPGARVRCPEQAATLRAIAEHGPDAFYTGSIGSAIASASWLSESDLAGYAPRWVEPLAREHRGLRVLELPPPSQGVAALEALAILEELGDSFPDAVAAVSLALEDAFAHVRDGVDVSHLLAPEHVRTRAAAAPGGGREPAGGTVYLCAVDGDGMAVSFIQSLYMSFGSGVLVPGTGVVLANRAACFAVNGRVEFGRRPYHTLMPGMLTEPDGTLVGPFGVMGGFIQAQAHVQFVLGALAEDLDPQATLDRGRFRVDGRDVHLEPPLWQHADGLERLGWRPIRSRDVSGFGGGQAIFARHGGLTGGSDPRKDGCALGV
jgi:gamma-glutamyltranspeptidase/glutathione hydrolase